LCEVGDLVSRRFDEIDVERIGDAGQKYVPRPHIKTVVAAQQIGLRRSTDHRLAGETATVVREHSIGRTWGLSALSVKSHLVLLPSRQQQEVSFAQRYDSVC